MKRSWTLEQLQKAVTESRSIRQVLIQLHLRPAGGNYAQVQKYIKEAGLDISHFKGQAWNKGVTGTTYPKKPIEIILKKGVNYQSSKLKKRLFNAGLKPKYCEECGWAKTSEDGRLPLELDHINGDRYDNRLENLRILCPNCHSLKPTYRGCNYRRYANAQVVEW